MTNKDQMAVVVVTVGMAGLAFLLFFESAPIGTIALATWVLLAPLDLWTKSRKAAAVPHSLARAKAVRAWRMVMAAEITVALAGLVVPALVNEKVSWGLVYALVFGAYRYLADKDGGNPFKGLWRKAKAFLADLSAPTVLTPAPIRVRS